MSQSNLLPQKTIAFLVLAALLCVPFSYQLEAQSRPEPAFASPRQFSTSGEVTVPVGGRLKQREASPQVVRKQMKGYGNRTPLLNEAIRLAPAYYPPGARVLDVDSYSDSSGQHFRVNLNRAFVNSRFWRGKKRRVSILAFHALARNIAFTHLSKGTALPVRFVIEGKSVARIGAFVTSRPLRPEKIIRAS